MSLEDLGIKNNNARAKLLSKTLDAATGKLLDNNKNPSPKTGQLDNRGSQFYLALYWAQELASQTEDAELSPGLPAGQTTGRQRGKNCRRAERGAGPGRPTSAATTSPTWPSSTP